MSAVHHAPGSDEKRLNAASTTNERSSRRRGATCSSTVGAHRCSSPAMLLGYRRPTGRCLPWMSYFCRDDNFKQHYRLELPWRRFWLPIFISILLFLFLFSEILLLCCLYHYFLSVTCCGLST